MVKVAIEDGVVDFDVQGLHKLWALKSRIRVPLGHVKGVRVDPEAARQVWKGWRLPGTHLPGVLVAGSFLKDGKWTFWDVGQTARAILVELTDERYHQLIIEVADPESDVARLRSATSA